MNNRKVCRLTLVALALCTLVWGTARAADPSEPKNIFIIGWDGAQRNHIKECLDRKELPTLKKLCEQGKMVEIDVEGTTDTKAGWSQILTGYYPEVTGVYSNGRYQPIPEGYSVPERLQKHFGPDKIFTFATVGKSGHVDADPPKKVRLDPHEELAKLQAKPNGKKAKKAEGKIVDEGGVKYRVVPGKPHYHMGRNIDFFKNGLVVDERVGTLAMELIEKHKDERMFGFIHFATVDHQGHKFGENSQEYTDALISNDTWTGKIIQKLKDLGQWDKTLIYVVADHGFDEGLKSHRNAPYTLLGTNDTKVVRGGLRQDVAPTVLERFGLDLSKIDPPLDGVPLTRECKRENVVLGANSPHAGRQAMPKAKAKPADRAAKPGKKAAKRKPQPATVR